MTTRRRDLLSCGDEYFRNEPPRRVLLLEIHGQLGVVVALDEQTGDEEERITVTLGSLEAPWDLEVARSSEEE